LGFDPAPGRPELVGALASRLAEVSEALRDVQRPLKPLRTSPDGWTGSAADAFAARVADLPTRLDGLRRALAAAEGTLLGWQAALRQLRDRAERVEARARAARHEVDAATELAEAARAHPDLWLDGQHFATDEALAEAQPTALGPLTLRFLEKTYVSVLTRQDNGNYKYDSVERERVVRTEPVQIGIDGVDAEHGSHERANRLLERLRRKAARRLGEQDQDLSRRRDRLCQRCQRRASPNSEAASTTSNATQPYSHAVAGKK